MTVRAACVIGWPVAHSRSPLIHGYWIKQHGLAADYRREALKPEEVADFFAGLSARGYVGCNVTLPHKEAALAASRAGRPRARRRRGQYLVARWRPASLHQHGRRRLHQQSRRRGAGLGSRAEGGCGARRRRLGAGGGLWPDRARLCAHPRGQSHVRSRAGVAREIWRRGAAGQLVGAAAAARARRASGQHHAARHGRPSQARNRSRAAAGRSSGGRPGLCAARNRASCCRATPWPCHRRRARHAAASGCAGLFPMVRRAPAGDPGIAGADRGRLGSGQRNKLRGLGVPTSDDGDNCRVVPGRI